MDKDLKGKADKALDDHHHSWVIDIKEKVAQKVGNKLEHTTLSQIINSTGIFYDPDPT